MSNEREIIRKTEKMIDELKSVCNTYGLGNTSSEYKIITELFLYKYLNDKFLYETKRVVKELNKDSSTKEVEQYLDSLNPTDFSKLVMRMNPNVARIKNEYRISYLFQNQNSTLPEFYELFDNALVGISNDNLDIFSVKTGSKEKIKLFDTLSQYITESDKKNLFLVTDSGYGLAFPAEEVPLVGVKAAGVKGMKLKDDYLVSANIFDFNQDEYITVITDKGTAKRVRLNEFELLSRARRGLQIVREVKTNPYKVLKTFVVDNKEFIGIKNGDIKTMKLTELPIADRYSTGSLISKHPLTDSFIVATLTKATKEEAVLIKAEDVEILDEQPVPKKERVSLKEIDDRLMTIDDFLN